MMSRKLIFILLCLNICHSIDILPWEEYLQLGSIRSPLGLTVNQSLLSHRHFLIGYLCLHSFIYDMAQKAFQFAIDTDPTLVEPHIGRLLGHKQALWSYTNRSGALQVWNDSWSIFASQSVSLAPIQSSYLNTVYQWYAYENISDGEEAFLHSMINLTQEYPSNIDAQTLLGLAYINKAERESIQLNVFEAPSLLTARNVLETALTHEPSHPGCLHYLIHAYDIPRVDVALQSVPYAHQYSQVALTASHAQHMPTHTWTHIGAWSLAQTTDARSIEVSVQLCLIEQQNLTNQTTTTLSVLSNQYNSSQFGDLLYCDRDNRAHSQQWLVHSYLQTCQYQKSINILSDLILSNRISPSDQYYLPFLYFSRGYIISNVFFWSMYNPQKNQGRFIQTLDEILDSTPIANLTDPNMASTYMERSEMTARFVECIRLLFINDTILIDDHLIRMTEISSIVQSKINSTSIRISLMISQLHILQLYLNQSFDHCLTELDRITQLERSLNKYSNRPSLLFIRSSELFALVLLLIHRDHHSYSLNYRLNNRTVSINAFPSYSLSLYQEENQTDPHRMVNTVGIARSYAQMGDIHQANQIYESILRICVDSTFSPHIDRMLIEEATDYLFNHKNNQSIQRSSVIFILCAFFIDQLLITK